MSVTVNGVRFNYAVDGPEGAPWVVCAHALANDLGLWDGLTARLSDAYRVLRYDQRGHGATEVVPGPYSFPMLLSDAIGLMNALDIEKAHWVGLSIGGMIGYGLAIEHGDRLHSVVACDSRPDAPPEYAAYFQGRIDKARTYGMAGLVDSTIERWFTPESVAQPLPQISRIGSIIASTSPLGHEGCCEALKTLSYGSRLHQINVPTLILGGAKDKGAPPEALAAAAAKIPGARHVVVPNAGHITVAENADFTERAIRAFLDETSNTG